MENKESNKEQMLNTHQRIHSLTHLSSSDVAIKVENVSKKFCKSLKRSMLYGVRDITRNAFGMSSNSHLLRKKEFWAIDDISFEVKKGETLGIIGSNGAGKTTMLKMLNGIFWPDKGKITINGKTGALISVGAGFHPMLSGRENIYLNGSILGMSRREVNKKFNKIVEFADIGDFLDTPVKFYSSGMFVRLGFAVAVYCNPDILLVDEVLAVGDLAFRLKCNRKMSAFRQKGGTVVLVAHNMNAIRNICDKVVWIDKGKIIEIGDVQRICGLFEESSMSNKEFDSEKIGRIFHYDQSVNIFKIEFLDKNNAICKSYKVGDYFKLRIYFNCKRIVNNPIFGVTIFSSQGPTISFNRSNLDGSEFSKVSGKGYVDFCIDKLPFHPSHYFCSVFISEEEFHNYLDVHEKCYKFIVAGNATNQGLMNPFPKWFLKCTESNL